MQTSHRTWRAVVQPRRTAQARSSGGGGGGGGPGGECGMGRKRDDGTWGAEGAIRGERAARRSQETRWRGRERACHSGDEVGHERGRVTEGRESTGARQRR